MELIAIKNQEGFWFGQGLFVNVVFDFQKKSIIYKIINFYLFNKYTSA